MEHITVFIKNDRPIGSCPQGLEAEWIKSLREEDNNQIDWDRELPSTETEWRAWARRQAQTGKDCTYP